MFPFQLPDSLLLEILGKIHEINLKNPPLQDWFFLLMSLLDEQADIHFGDLVVVMPSSNGNGKGLKVVSYIQGKVKSHADFPNPFIAHAYRCCDHKKNPDLTEIQIGQCPSELPYCPVVVPLGCREYHFGAFAAGSFNDRAVVMRNSRLFRILGMEMSRFLYATHMSWMVSKVLFEQSEDAMSFEELLTFKFRQLMDRIDPAAGGNIMGDIITLVERILIQLSLDKTGHKLGYSATLLGINRNTLRKKIQALGIDTKDA